MVCGGAVPSNGRKQAGSQFLPENARGVTEIVERISFKLRWCSDQGRTEAPLGPQRSSQAVLLSADFCPSERRSASSLWCRWRTTNDRYLRFRIINQPHWHENRCRFDAERCRLHLHRADADFCIAPQPMQKSDKNVGNASFNLHRILHRFASKSMQTRCRL